MRLRRTSLLLVPSTLIFALTALATMHEPAIIRECPQCQTLLEQRKLEWIDLIIDRSWTDGMTTPQLPDLSLLMKCPKCGTVFWIDEAKKLGVRESWNKQDEWANAVAPKVPSEMDYLKFTSEHKLDSRQELYARLRAWWAANDKIRMNENATVRFSPIQRRNLRALFNLLDEEYPDQRIRKAEILRELGQFRECVQLLAQPFEDDRDAQLAAFIRNLAGQKLRLVREIKEENNP
jgi:hypothetical protein